MRSVDVLGRVRRRVGTLPEAVRPQFEIIMKDIQAEVEMVDNVLSCTACPLAEGCTNKVPGLGPVPSDIMFVGEGPGENEDLQGKPFVGLGGQMITKAIEAVGWDRDTLFITNVVKCRPPKNRTPLVSEVTACYGHLQKEIQLVKPKVVVCLGATAANTLIHPDFKITQEHGHWFERDGIRYIAVYHPSYLLRLGEGSEKQNAAKWEVFEALKKVKQFQDSGF